MDKNPTQKLTLKERMKLKMKKKLKNKNVSFVPSKPFKPKPKNMSSSGIQMKTPKPIPEISQSSITLNGGMPRNFGGLDANNAPLTGSTIQKSNKKNLLKDRIRAKKNKKSRKNSEQVTETSKETEPNARPEKKSQWEDDSTSNKLKLRTNDSSFPEKQHHTKSKFKKNSNYQDGPRYIKKNQDKDHGRFEKQNYRDRPFKPSNQMHMNQQMFNQNRLNHVMNSAMQANPSMMFPGIYSNNQFGFQFPGQMRFNPNLQNAQYMNNQRMNMGGHFYQPVNQQKFVQVNNKKPAQDKAPKKKFVEEVKKAKREEPIGEEEKKVEAARETEKEAGEKEVEKAEAVEKKEENVGEEEQKEDEDEKEKPAQEREKKEDETEKEDENKREEAVADDKVTAGETVEEKTESATAENQTKEAESKAEETEEKAEKVAVERNEPEPETATEEESKKEETEQRAEEAPEKEEIPQEKANTVESEAVDKKEADESSEKKQEEAKAQEDAPAEQAPAEEEDSDDDTDEYEEVKPTETPEEQLKRVSKNYSKIVYLESELLEFIDKFNQDIPEKYRDLRRDFKSQVTKNMSKGSRYRDDYRKDRKKSRYGRRDRDRGRGRDRDRDRRKEYKKNDYEQEHVKLEREKFDEETTKRLREIKENFGGWMYEKKNESEDAKTRKKIKFLLNQLTMDTLRKIQSDLVNYCYDKELACFMMDELVKKAWKEVKYRNCYSKLVKKVTGTHFDWEDLGGKKSGKKKKKPALLKKRIIAKLEKQYSQGFAEYQAFTEQIQNDASLSKEDKTDKILKKKDGLFGNVLFMAQLFVKGVVRINSFKLIVVHGLISVCQTYIEFSNTDSKTHRAILLDYVEALIKLWEDAGSTYEKKQREQVEKERRNKKNTLSQDNDHEVADSLLTFMEHKEFGWDADIKSDQQMKKTIFGITNVLRVFLNVLNFIRDKELDVRLNSLIENFEDLRKRKWERIFRGQAAAESKKNIEKKIREEKRQEQEMMRKSSRRNHRGHRNYRDNDYYDYNDYYGEDDYDYNYDDRRDDEFYVASEKNFKKNKKKKKYKNVEQQAPPAGKSGAACAKKTEELLRNFYKSKNFDGAQFKKVWDISEEPCDDIADFLKEYLVVFMDQGRETEVELRKQVIYDWVEQEKMNAEQFMKGFNMGHKISFQDYSDKYKYLAQLSQVLCWMISNHGVDLAQLEINTKVKGKPLDDEDDVEDLQFFYTMFFKELKKEIAKIEDEAVRADALEKCTQLEKTSEKVLTI